MMSAIGSILRKLLPASLLSLSGCVLLLLLLPVSVLDMLLQAGCEQCFGVSPEGLFVVNGVESRQDPHGGPIVLRIEVGSRGRPFDVLVRQIMRLFDVRHACVVEAQAGRRLVC